MHIQEFEFETSKVCSSSNVQICRSDTVCIPALCETLVVPPGVEYVSCQYLGYHHECLYISLKLGIECLYISLKLGIAIEDRVDVISEYVYRILSSTVG